MEYLMLNSTIELVNEFKEEMYYINILQDLKSTDQPPEFLQAGHFFILKKIISFPIKTRKNHFSFYMK